MRVAALVSTHSVKIGIQKLSLKGKECSQNEPQFTDWIQKISRAEPLIVKESFFPLNSSICFEWLIGHEETHRESVGRQLSVISPT
jgi:hypothetical protein